MPVWKHLPEMNKKERKNAYVLEGMIRLKKDANGKITGFYRVGFRTWVAEVLHFRPWQMFRC